MNAEQKERYAKSLIEAISALEFWLKHGEECVTTEDIENLRDLFCVVYAMEVSE